MWQKAGMTSVGLVVMRVGVLETRKRHSHPDPTPNPDPDWGPGTPAVLYGLRAAGAYSKASLKRK